MGGILSTRNILGTLGGAMVAGPAGAAVGSYAIGKKGLLGAAVAYFAAPIVLPYVQQVLGQVTGGGGSNGGSW